MLHVEVGTTALLTGLWTPLAVAAITAAASVVIAVMGVRTDDLKRAERLSEVLTDMEPSPEKSVVATIRDDFAVAWALRQAAPVDHRLRRIIVILSTAGGMLLAGAIVVGVYVGLGYGTVSDWFFWVYYSLALALLLFAWWARAIAARRSREWIRQERSRRALREPLHEDLRREATTPSSRSTRPGPTPAPDASSPHESTDPSGAAP